MGRAADLQISDDDYGVVAKLLTSEGTAFKVQIADVQELVRRERVRGGARGGGWHSQYHRLGEVKYSVTNICTTYTIYYIYYRSERDLRSCEVT